MSTPTTPTATEPVVDPRQLRRVARALDGALWLVALAVGVYSLSNVHTVAIAHGTADPQAWLLAPIVDVALFGAITADSVLSRHNAPRSGWGTALRWFCGLATWTLNAWDAAGSGDAGAIVAHSIPPIVLILLAEAAPHYRAQFAKLVRTAPNPAPAPATAPAPTAPPAALAPEPVTPVAPEPAPTTPGRRAASTRQAGSGASRRDPGAGRRQIARLYAAIPADDARSGRQLAADLAAEAGLSPATVRRYIADIHRAAAGSTPVPATAGGAA
ncbi:winged helix-turn-helix domain-containing protein [Candidatus Frankia nodulisporulans]|uniref:winged helix-turn-helix domain-containing protein n=1 Tax=Candidatus Frankia nodulisporulans TaxID=2060052 RepID=UPI0013D39D1F|nr:winged helix-turn-helix domain-containing protein [Candidatus Frankia nodulisporulans]